jgi:hypothetical protein
MNSEEQANEAFERRVQARLEQETRALGPDVERALRLARHAALEAAKDTAATRRWRWRFGAALAAGIALVAVASLLRPGEPALAPDTAQPIMADLDVLSADDELEMLDELEFYTWLSGQEDVI